MAIKFNCPHCKKSFTVKDHLAGKRAQCPACKQVLTVPAAAPVRAPNAADLEALAAATLAEEPKAAAPVPPRATIEFKCYYCDETVRVGADLAGKQTPCPECRRIIKVPLLEKNQPKDWRKVEARLPAGARRVVGPAPEGTWDTSTVGSVSRQALVDAQAIPQARPRLSPAQWVKRGTAVAAGVAVIGTIAWTVSHFLALGRQNQALVKAVQYLEPAGKLSSEAAAEVHRAAGEYCIRASSRENNAEEARAHFQQARAAILQATKVSPLEREAFLIELAVSQIDLGGERPDIEKATRLPWDQAHKEIRQTLQNLTSADGRGEAVRQVTRRLIAKEQGDRAAALASFFPDEGPELLAVVGLEMLHAKQEQLAETLANQAQQSIAPQAQPAGEQKPPAAPPAPSLIALWLALGKADRAAAVAPPGAAGKEQDLVLVGRVEGLARQGKWDEAREPLRPLSAPEQRLPALLALAAAAADSDQAAVARPDVENALSLAAGELKAIPASPWQLLRLARFGVQAGLEDRVGAVARLVPDVAVRGRMQLEVLRGRLASTKDRANDSWIQIVDPNAPAHAHALELLARHNARHGGAAAVQKTVESWDEKLQPFGYIGVALGLQDRD